MSQLSSKLGVLCTKNTINMKKLFLSIILSVVSASFVVPVLAVDECTCEVSLSDGTATVCGYESSVPIGSVVGDMRTGLEGAFGSAACTGVSNIVFTSSQDATLLDATLCPTLDETTLANDPSSLNGSTITCTVVSSTSPSTPSSFTPPSSTPLINPLSGNMSAESIPDFVGNIIERVLGILGSISLVVFMYGAFKWITSEGESDDIAEGTHTMAYAAIGILVIFASYGILSSVIGGITRGG